MAFLEQLLHITPLLTHLQLRHMLGYYEIWVTVINLSDIGIIQVHPLLMITMVTEGRIVFTIIGNDSIEIIYSIIGLLRQCLVKQLLNIKISKWKSEHSNIQKGHFTVKMLKYNSLSFKEKHDCKE